MTTTSSTSEATGSSASKVLRGAVPELVLVGWTLFVWVGRLRNIAADDTLDGWGLAWRTVLAATFVGLALALTYALLRRSSATRYAALALAGFGIAVWAVRGIDIVLGDHSVGFIAVHMVLALVTIVLGVIVGRRWLSS